ncbi:MAG TPA: MFS transporter [Stenotrophomonas sp.]|nr:MFS transporter [Stenotrophomonas sp.]
MSTASHYPRIKQSLVLLMAVATGLAVASNYYAQPLLQTLAQTFGVDARSAGMVVTVAQLAYAAGLLLIVPLGDRLERRGLIVGLFVLCAVGLLVSAASSTFTVLLLGTLVTGLCSVAAQVLVPYAATLAAPHERGRVVGTVMSGLLLGILLARTISGLLADAGGWHTVYWVAAGLMLVVAALLWRGLPRHDGDASLSYPRLIFSVLTLLRDEPVLRGRAVLGGLIFAGFSVFWTTLAFLLAGPDYHYGTGVIGLFGLIGAAGALAANLGGKLSDRGHGTLASWGGLVMLLLSWALLWAAPHSLWLLVIGVLLLDVAVQGVHVNNQSVIYQLDAAARNRITSAYMTCYFIGGALGSSAGTIAYARGGWHGVVVVGAALAVLALGWMALVAERRTAAD